MVEQHIFMFFLSFTSMYNECVFAKNIQNFQKLGRAFVSQDRTFVKGRSPHRAEDLTTVRIHGTTRNFESLVS
jgi:hypothetical protein